MKPLLQVYPLNAQLGGRCFVGTHRIKMISEWDDGSVMVDTDDNNGWVSTREWLDECLDVSRETKREHRSPDVSRETSHAE